MQIKLIKGVKMRINSIPSYRVYNQNTNQRNCQSKPIHFGEYEDDDMLNHYDKINEIRNGNSFYSGNRSWSSIFNPNPAPKFKINKDQLISLIEPEITDELNKEEEKLKNEDNE